MSIEIPATSPTIASRLKRSGYGASLSKLIASSDP